MKRLPAPNVIDKAIAVFAPRVAARRLVARQALALMGGGYSGARRDRASLAGWHTSAGSPEADVILDLPTLRARSRDAERNQPVAAAVVNTTVSHAVGTGLTCNPRIDAKFLGLSEEQADVWQQDTRRRFLAWFTSKDCDYGRRQNGYELQDLALRCVLASGDALVITPMVQRPGAPYATLALQIIEADRMCNPAGRQNTATLTDGVECDAETGEAIAYQVCNQHPGDLFARGSRTWQRIEARGAQSGRLNAIHLYKILRPNLRRGVPILAPVLEPLKQLDRFTKAELDAAVASSLFALFAEMDPGAFEQTFTEESQQAIVDRASKWTGEIESMKLMNLLPGEKVTSPTPGRPNPEFDPFFSACVRQIGMAVGLPYEVLVMHYQSSYSAARGALLMAWRFFMGWRDWLSTNLCQPVYELWLTGEVAAGRIGARGFFADPVVRCAWAGAQWVGDGPGSIDPVKEVEAAQKRVELRISTLQAESQLYDGGDWERKHEQLVREAKAAEAAGMPPPGNVTPAPPPPPEPAPAAPNAAQSALAEAVALFARVQADALAREPAPPPEPQPVTVNQAPVTVNQAPVNVTNPDIKVDVHIPPQPTPAPPPVQRLTRKVVERDGRGLITNIREEFLDDTPA